MSDPRMLVSSPRCGLKYDTMATSPRITTAISVGWAFLNASAALLAASEVALRRALWRILGDQQLLEIADVASLLCVVPVVHDRAERGLGVLGFVAECRGAGAGGRGGVRWRREAAEQTGGDRDRGKT